MKTIEKKIKDICFNKIIKGDKKFEYRLADFGLGTDYKFIIVNEETNKKIEFYIKNFRYVTGEELEKGAFHYVGYAEFIKTISEFYDKTLIFKYGAYIIEIPDKESFL